MTSRKAAKVMLSGIGLLSAVAAGCGGVAEDRPAAWGYIAPAIIEPSCATASCHSDVAARAGVALNTAAVALKTLTERHFIIPNNSKASELIFLLRAQGARRMPPDFVLPDADIRLIEAWIDSGAAQ